MIWQRIGTFIKYIVNTGKKQIELKIDNYIRTHTAINWKCEKKYGEKFNLISNQIKVN